MIPNVPLDDVPVGKDEHDNVEVRKVGERAAASELGRRSISRSAKRSA